jgi:hypothetical protein
VKHLEFSFLIVGVVASISLVAGIFRPWIMLWWKEKQNRRMVIALYGSIALISFLIHMSLRFL